MSGSVIEWACRRGSYTLLESIVIILIVIIFIIIITIMKMMILMIVIIITLFIAVLQDKCSFYGVIQYYKKLEIGHK